MNDIYWREKRYPSAFVLEQIRPSSISNRLHHHIHLPYASNAYGVYRRIPEFSISPYRTNRFSEFNHHRNVSHKSCCCRFFWLVLINYVDIQNLRKKNKNSSWWAYINQKFFSFYFRKNNDRLRFFFFLRLLRRWFSRRIFFFFSYICTSNLTCLHNITITTNRYSFVCLRKEKKTVRVYVYVCVYIYRYIYWHCNIVFSLVFTVVVSHLEEDSFV